MCLSVGLYWDEGVLGYNLMGNVYQEGDENHN